MLEILLADDDLEVLASLTRGLRAAGHAVTSTRDGQAALDTARGHRFDAILAAVAMPGLNGFQLCRRLHAQPETASVPVILMSAKVDAADLYWAGEVGARALLAKPVAPADALARLAQLATTPGGPSP